MQVNEAYRGKRGGKLVRLMAGLMVRLMARLMVRLMAGLMAGLLMAGLLASCGGRAVPKPSGHLRIDLPEKEYVLYDEQDFYAFEIPVYARAITDRHYNDEPGWINLEVASLNSTIHLSYKAVEDNLGDYIMDARTLAYKHVVKADGIEESPFIDREKRRFGMVYDLSGEVASTVQFFITDSTSHFLRGSLYFNCRPNRDSLNPAISFMREDIMHLLETTRWKYE